VINVTVSNFATAFADTDLQPLASALSIQVNRDFLPAWGVQAKLWFTQTGQHPHPDHWVLGLYDDADQAGALGYHDVTPAGQPLGKIFVKTTLADGGLVSVTASHELLEMLGDPNINLAAERDDASGAPSKFYAYEVADACESDSDGYDIILPAGWVGAGKVIHVSDFVLPSWFESFRTDGPFDFMDKIHSPFQLLSGGYIGYLDLSNLAAGWQQEIAGAAMSARQKVAARPHVGSRRYRRSMRRNEWVPSTYTPGTSTEIKQPKVN
jgi:hypothetical protein